MPRKDTTKPEPLTQEALNPYDTLIIDHADLDDFIGEIGGVSNLPDDITVFTEDKYTKNSVQFNLIVTDNETSDSEFGIATQLHNPTTKTSDILDLREDTQSFSDALQGLTQHPQ